MATVEIDLRPPQAARLEAFLGRWVVTGSIEATESRAQVDGQWSFRPAVDGWGVLGTMLTTIDGLGNLEEAALIGLDATTNHVHMISANKFGIRDHVGRWVDANRLEVEFSRSDDDGHVSEAITVNFEQSDRIVARAVERRDGNVISITDLTFSRDEADEVRFRDTDRDTSEEESRSLVER